MNWSFTKRVDTGPFIGNCQLKNPFVLAPMAGLTNWPFRQLALKAGAALTVTEMLSSVALSFRGPATLKMLKTERDLERPFCVQLFGKDPEKMAQAARLVSEEYGADIVDLNMACPARKVVGSGHGAALLKDFQLAEKIVKKVVGAVKVPVTVKTRPGFAPGMTDIFTLGPRLVDCGVAAIILHPRYASMGFGGEADWNLVGRLADLLSVPVIGSGDITTAKEAVERYKNYGVAAVMIGRASRGRPWIFQQCLSLLNGHELPEPCFKERLEVAIRHARLLEAELGPKVAFRLRSVLMWYTRDLPGAARLRAEICQEQVVDRQLQMMEEAFLAADSGQAALVAGT